MTVAPTATLQALLGRLLGADIAAAGDEQLAVWLSGSEPLPTGGGKGQCWAANYGGHQFGQWVGQLGDGRVSPLLSWVGALLL